jgi:hypothetical protein
VPHLFRPVLADLCFAAFAIARPIHTEIQRNISPAEAPLRDVVRIRSAPLPSGRRSIPYPVNPFPMNRLFKISVTYPWALCAAARRKSSAGTSRGPRLSPRLSSRAAGIPRRACRPELGHSSNWTPPTASGGRTTGEVCSQRTSLPLLRCKGDHEMTDTCESQPTCTPAVSLQKIAH